MMNEKELLSESRIINEFLEEMQTKDIILCEYTEKGYFPLNLSFERIIANYFQIDLEIAEKERIKLLNDFRKKENKKNKECVKE